MGGDFAPEAAVKGAVMALGELGADCRIVLFGDRERILAVLAAEGCPAEKFDIVPTTEVIEMGDHPAKAFQTKTDSSITVGFGYLAKGAIQGFASAGSTGAMMVGSMYAVKPIEGVIRPTISSVVPTISGRPTLLLDVGLNVDCKPEVLAQYGVIGSIYAEAVLAQRYRTTVNGKVTGGPAYYIRAAFKGTFGKVLAGVFSVLIILALGFMGNMVQSNSIGDAFHNAFGMSHLAVGIVVALIAAFIFLGGVQRIAAVTEKIVPIMAAFYIVGCVVIMVMNYKTLPNAFTQIFVLAFNPQAMAGGVAGVTVQQAMRFGVARGLFSNEAGMGSTPHAHALAKVNHPREQGAVAILGVFIDTFVVLTLTGLVLITSGLIPDGLTGTALTQAAFSLTFGSFGKVFIAICMLFFAFSTILGWYFFGQVNFNALFGSKYTKVYSLIVVLFILIGSSLKVDLVWALADFFNGLMAVPNLLALLALSGVVAGIARNKKD